MLLNGKGMGYHFYTIILSFSVDNAWVPERLYLILYFINIKWYYYDNRLTIILKKYILIFLGCIISGQVCAQQRIVVLDSAWGSWRASQCYEHIFFKLKVHWHDTVKNTIKYDIRLKSQYDQEVAVSYGIREEKNAYRGPRLRIRIEPYQEIDAGFNIVGKESFVVIFSKLRMDNGLEEWDTGDNQYHSCDNDDPSDEDYFVPGGEQGKTGN